MLLTVEAIRNDYFECMDSILATIAHYMNKPYSLMFTGCMGFEYSPIKKGATSLGEKLSEGACHSPKYSLEKYHGIKVSRHDADSHKYLHCLIEKMLNSEMPVCVCVDRFYCPWDYAYNKFHISHYYLIIGIDETKKEYICLDPNSSLKKYPLPWECLEKGCREYFTFENKVSSNANFSLSDILHSNYFSHECSEIIEKRYNDILKFARDLVTYIDFDRELSPWVDNLQDTFLFRCLRNIGQNRLKFSDALYSLSNAFDNKNIFCMAKQAKDLYALWDNVSTLIFKYHFIRDETSKSVIFDSLVSIAESEKKLQISLANEAEICKGFELQFETLQTKCSYDSSKSLDFSVQFA